MSTVVAERLLRDPASGACVTARLFAPEKIGQSEWSCKIEVQGLASPLEQSIIGVDSFQALYLALRVLCALLEKHEEHLAFLDGPTGDCSLPLIVPWDFGPALKSDVDRLIQRKIKESLNTRP